MIIYEVPLEADQVLDLLDNKLLLYLRHELALIVDLERVLIIVMEVQDELFLDFGAELVEADFEGADGAVFGPLLLAVLLVDRRKLLEEGSVREVEIGHLIWALLVLEIRSLQC